MKSAAAVFSATGLMAMGATAMYEPMLEPMPGYEVRTLFTVGETVDGYTPPGVLDGLGAYSLDKDTLRVLGNHELLSFRGYEYEVSDGMGGTFSLPGARISYFDFDKDTAELKASGLAYDTIYDANGDIASDVSFQPEFLSGFSRFCSAVLVEPKSFPGKRGLEDRIYFTGEEDGGFYNPVGGACWALNPEDGTIWHVPDFGRGAWENLTVLDSGRKDTVAVLLSDDSSPYDHDQDGEKENAPLYLYVGEKDPSGDFLARNGLRGGKLYVFVSDTGELTANDFNTSGSIKGTWVEVDNARNEAKASETGSTGYDEFGYPTQSNLWIQAENLGAFGFSRPEDVATNPRFGHQAVLASTGVDTYAENGVDTFGTLYLVNTEFNTLKCWLTIFYDGDADPTRALRSPDNLDWADDGFIYVQEDKAETKTLDGEYLFGGNAVNTNEAGIVRVHPVTGATKRIANIDRSVLIDPTIVDPYAAVDQDAGTVGAWETSGIIDVSSLLGRKGGSVFILDVQAHGLDDQEEFDASSRLSDYDLVEGGQLVALFKQDKKKD